MHTHTHTHTLFPVSLQLFQIYNAKMNYLGWENLIEWIVYISALLLVIDFNGCQEDTGIRFVRVCVRLCG